MATKTAAQGPTIHDSKKFSWKNIREIESKIMSERERIMPLMQSTLEPERERGQKEGKKEGEKKGQEAVALQMLEDGLPVEAICKYTGLTSPDPQLHQNLQSGRFTKYPV